MDKRQVLLSQGWGLLPIYVGRQSDSQYLNAQKGLADADDAVTLAVYAGFPVKTTIYLDIETAFPLDSDYMVYVSSWVHEVQSKGDDAGIYCNTCTADQLKNALGGSVEFWVAHYTENNLPASALSPGDTGVTYAGTWQFAGDSELTYEGFSMSIDLDVSTSRDPSTLS